MVLMSSKVILVETKVQIEFTFDDVEITKAFEFYKFNTNTLTLNGQIYATIESIAFSDNGVLVSANLTDKIFDEFKVVCIFKEQDYYRSLDIVSINLIAI